MFHRPALATTITVVASLATGAVAVAATVRGVESDASTRPAAVVSAAPAADETPLATLPDGQPAPERVDGADEPTAGAPTDPKAQWLLAPSGAPTAGTAAPSGASGTTAKPSSGASDVEHAPTPSTSPTTKAPVATTPTTAPYNCFGSDDGMTEAYKHAREEWCHAHGFDD